MRPERTRLMVVHQQRVPPQFTADTEGIRLTLKIAAIHDSRFAERSPRGGDVQAADNIVDNFVSVQQIERIGVALTVEGYADDRRICV